MKQSLDLKFGQHLTITPQLQQAIRLLQLSSVELQQEIQEVLETNPLLEEIEREDDAAEVKAESDADITDSRDNGEASTFDETEMLPATESGEDMDSNDGADDDWAKNFESMTAPMGSGSTSDDGFPDIDARNSPPQPLHDHLLWQMHMTPFSDDDRQIALA